MYKYECELGTKYNSPLGFYYKEFDDGIYLFLNATIVSSGYATPVRSSLNVRYADLFEKLYKEAMEQN